VPACSGWVAGTSALSPYCYATAGRATLRLGIKNGRLVILDLHIRNGKAAAQED